jgi:hypothetical protein
MSYTFNRVYPVLAMVEDENPPAYEPLSLNDPDATFPATPEEDGATTNVPKPTNGKPRTVTSSFRAIHKVLYATGGWRAYFRGFFCLLAIGLASGFLSGIFVAFLPMIFSSVATLLSQLALIQLSTAWVHIIMSPPSKLPFWRRLPPFRKAFDAAARPAVLYWLALEVTNWVPYLVALAVGLRMPTFDKDFKPTFPKPTEGQVSKSFLIFFITIILQIFLVIPAHVILVRVQSSLLPPDEDTIIPFDRSFEGKVEPAVVGGKGYVSMLDAWMTFSRAAWKRLIILYVKIFIVSTAIFVVMTAVLIPEVILMAKNSTLKNPN